MGTLLVSVLFGHFVLLYVIMVVIQRLVLKKWDFGISISFLFFSLLPTVLAFIWANQMIGRYVDTNVECEWKEQVAAPVKYVEDVSVAPETEGFMMLVFGSVSEREVMRYSYVNSSGERRRGMLYTSDCVLQEAEGVPRIMKVVTQRVYADPVDKRFFGGLHDVKSEFYRAFVL